MDDSWYCGHCGYGPMLSMVDAVCVGCGKELDAYATFSTDVNPYRAVVTPRPPSNQNTSEPSKQDSPQPRPAPVELDTSGPSFQQDKPPSTIQPQRSKPQGIVPEDYFSSGDYISEEVSTGSASSSEVGGIRSYQESSKDDGRNAPLSVVAEGPFVRGVRKPLSATTEDFNTSLLDIEPPKEERLQEISESPWPDCGLRHYLASVKLTVVAFLRLSPRAGCRRITWVCGCGKPMYADVEESYVGGADSLQAALRKAAAPAAETAGYNTTSGVHPQTSPSSSVAQQSAHGVNTNQSSSRIPDPGDSILSGGVPHLRQLTSTDIYLLLCIKGRGLMELEQIEIKRDGDDQVMFQDIRRAYLKIRQQQKADFQPETPEIIRKISRGLHYLKRTCQSQIVRMFQYLRLGWLVWWIGDNVFYIPTSANFVRFELIPIKTRLCPEILSAPSLPPESEVFRGKYHYIPCPQDVKDPLLRIPYLHVLFEPGNHLNQFWTNRTPKKLNTRMEYGTGVEPIIGWGIHLVEGSNWMAVLAVSEVVLVLSLVVAVGYSVGRGDASSGFAMGAYVATVLAVSNGLGMVFLAQSS